MHISFQISVFISCEQITKKGITGSYDRFFLSFGGIFAIVFHSGYNNLQSHHHCTNVLFSPQPLQHLSFLILLTITILNTGEVISHWGFDLYFCDDQHSWASFHAPVVHFCVFFGFMFIQYLCAFLNRIIWTCLLVNCMSYEFSVYLRY